MSTSLNSEMIRSTILLAFLICLAASKLVWIEISESDEFISDSLTGNDVDSNEENSDSIVAYNYGGEYKNNFELGWNFRNISFGKRQRGKLNR
jgi:hypothetical protein